MLLMQNIKPIAYTKRKQILFVFDLAMFSKIMQVNGIVNVITTTNSERPTYLVNYSKKLRVWHK